MNLAERKEAGEVRTERREVENGMYERAEVVRVYEQGPL